MSNKSECSALIGNKDEKRVCSTSQMPERTFPSLAVMLQCRSFGIKVINSVEIVQYSVYMNGFSHTDSPPRSKGILEDRIDRREVKLQTRLNKIDH